MGEEMVRNKMPRKLTDDQSVVEIEPWIFGTDPNNSIKIRVESVCDFGINPSIPGDHRSFRVLKHDRFGGVKKVVKFFGGNLYVDGLKVFSSLVSIQREQKVEGFRICGVVRNSGHHLANANFVDFLRYNPDFYPTNHKVHGHCLVSWGTVYHDLISSHDCLKAVRWNKDLRCAEYVTKSLLDVFCDKCFHISFA